jgi:GNAT superfamily N-acetyltransferase
MPPRISLTSVPEDTGVDLRPLEEGLRAHADAVGLEPRDYHRLTLLLLAEEEDVVGGLHGSTAWGWLHVKLLWVAEHLRRRGWGARLMEAAEKEAVDRGCRHAYVETFGFQALEFYKRLGYEVFGALSDFPRGEARFFLQRRDLGARMETHPEGRERSLDGS